MALTIRTYNLIFKESWNANHLVVSGLPRAYPNAAYVCTLGSDPVLQLCEVTTDTENQIGLLKECIHSEGKSIIGKIIGASPPVAEA